MSETSELVRVPSGNIQSDILSDFMSAPAAARDCTARALFPLSMNIAPDIVINGPRGVNCKDFFAIIDVFLGINLNAK